MDNIGNLGLVLLYAAAVLFLIINLLQYLWNSTMPYIFKLPVINFWQSFRLLLISVLLLSGFKLFEYPFIALLFKSGL